ncbi:MAG: glycosyltransferase family 39 protein [Chthoniobacterales bacterium]
MKAKTALRTSRRMTIACLCLFAVGAGLRLLLCWVNPPGNAFDNHYEPILMIIKTGVIPAKDACFQCYHPPVFYISSALIGGTAEAAGMTLPAMVKLLQFVCCFYGILLLPVCYLILNKFPLSDLAKIIAFASVCFLPRHIYMSAMHSNDTLSYLLVAVSLYLTIIALERGLALPWLLLLSLTLTVTIFTKYTAFAILPAVLAAILWSYRTRLVEQRKPLLVSLVVALGLPSLALGAYVLHNERHYNSALPWNVTLYDPAAQRPRDPGGINFWSFKPWEYARHPMLMPGHIHSFWTMLYSGMWFDTEPYFISVADTNAQWWQRYYRWYRGEDSFPADLPQFSRLITFPGGALIILGLVPLALMVEGCWAAAAGRWPGKLSLTPAQRASLVLFAVLLLCNIAEVVALTLRLPVYNAIKPSYLLNSSAAFLIFIAIGVMFCERNRVLRATVLASGGAIVTIATVHALHLIAALHHAG